VGSALASEGPLCALNHLTAFNLELDTAHHIFSAQDRISQLVLTLYPLDLRSILFAHVLFGSLKLADDFVARLVMLYIQKLSFGPSRSLCPFLLSYDFCFLFFSYHRGFRWQFAKIDPLYNNWIRNVIIRQFLSFFDQFREVLVFLVLLLALFGLAVARDPIGPISQSLKLFSLDFSSFQLLAKPISVWVIASRCCWQLFRLRYGFNFYAALG